MTRLSPANWEDAVNNRFRRIRRRFVEEGGGFKLNLNRYGLTFAKKPSNFQVSPNGWLRTRHAESQIHEPRLVSWLFALAEAAGDRSVRFYDIGALFGYHAFIAASVFENVEVVAVEGNPMSADYIAANRDANRLSRFTVINAVLDNYRAREDFIIEGFEFIPAATRRSEIRRTRLMNLTKKLLNRLGASLTIETLLIRSIETYSLSDVLLPLRPDGIDILKIDTEGYQAVFLPPATQELIDREAILLLEIDATQQMESFGTTNQDLIQPFLDSGYAAFWVLHRREGSHVERITSIEARHDRNALVVLMPSAFVLETGADAEPHHQSGMSN